MYRFFWVTLYVFSHKERAWWGWQGGVMMHVGDMYDQKWVLKEGKLPGVILPPRKSISQIGNPSSGWPTPRFYCRGGGGVCSYWILTGNTEEGAPERPMHSYRPHKTQECSPSATQLLRTNIFSTKMLASKSFSSLIRLVIRLSSMVSNSHISTSKTYSQVMITVHNTNLMSDLNKRQTDMPNNHL